MTDAHTKLSYGLEIELPWSTMLRRVDPEAATFLLETGGFYRADEQMRARIQQGFDAVDARYKHAIDSVFGDDIRRGRDAYVEFALQPKETMQELTDTVNGLYDKSLLLEGEAYPLQCTIGNIPASPASSYILLAAEVCGGTSGARISELNTWAKRGVGGLWNRHAKEMQLGMKRGVELRSLQLMGMQTLRSAALIIESTAQLAHAREIGVTDANNQWQEFVRILKGYMAEKDIVITKPWWNPVANEDPWARYADALEDTIWREAFASDLHAQLQTERIASTEILTY